MVRETESMEPTDEVLQGRMSNPAGCNASEPTGSLVTLSYGGRASEVWAKTASFNVGVVGRIERGHRGGRGDTLGKRDGETWETLPCQLSLFKGEFKRKGDCPLFSDDFVAKHQKILFAEDTPSLKRFLVQRFKGQTLSCEDIEEETYLETRFIDKHYREALKELEMEGKVNIDRISSKKSGLKGNDRITFV